MEFTNTTMEWNFVLIGFPGSSTFRYLMFLGLLLVFLVTLTGNLLVIGIILTNHHLHRPMYFFVANLSFMETVGICFLIPNTLMNFLLKNMTISKIGCLIQSFVFFLLSTSDFFLLSVMSFDRYVAVCHPLRYLTIMSKKLCFGLLIFCFTASLVTLLYPTILIINIKLCGRVVNHFFCDNWSVFRLVCVDTSRIKFISLISAVFVLVGSLFVTAISYVCIICTIIRIPSNTGRQKTISTCVSHFTMVSIVYGSAIFMEIRPKKTYSIEKDKVVHLLSILIVPLLNPFVYTLRNETVKKLIRNFLQKKRM